jgi:hypothetical protein
VLCVLFAWFACFVVAMGRRGADTCTRKPKSAINSAVVCAVMPLP